VATRICGNLTEREEDQFTARFLVAIFGFFWFSWLAVLERQFSLLCLFISFETPAGTRDDNWLASSVFLVFHFYRGRQVLLHCGLISDGKFGLVLGGVGRSIHYIRRRKKNFVFSLSLSLSLSLREGTTLVKSEKSVLFFIFLLLCAEFYE